MILLANKVAVTAVLSISPPLIRERLERMAEFVDETITRFQQQRLKIDKLKFDFRHCLQDATNDWVRLVNKCIGIALDNNVEEISLVCRYGNLPPHLPISERILSAPSVISLELAGLALAPSSNSTNLQSLRSLTLERISVDDETFKRLMSACHSLEFLFMAQCTGLTKIRVSGLRNIRAVNLAETFYPVEIEAPSLESFHYTFFPLEIESRVFLCITVHISRG
ncbi:hypothetical protein CDL15_Pgr011102 [Punica granatum]|uniref:At1g61320/AtMIF1 LRR domain-containing protein n=1 Tax=Punica granatum TaxID=22663 RepID=A0A218XNC4_PUNGR|nr:hypothetical protein CDL15_Pgr011102 [Punica granatum]